MTHAILVSNILDLSDSTVWKEAVKEWDVADIYELDGDLETCLCGHYPIKQLCYLENNTPFPFNKKNDGGSHYPLKYTGCTLCTQK